MATKNIDWFKVSKAHAQTFVNLNTDLTFVKFTSAPAPEEAMIEVNHLTSVAHNPYTCSSCLQVSADSAIAWVHNKFDTV